MKRSLKATLLAALGITTFTGVALTSVKVNQPIASNKVKTFVAHQTQPFQDHHTLPKFEINATNTNYNTYLSPGFGKYSNYTTLFPAQNQNSTKSFQISFGGEVAEARMASKKIPIKMPDGKDIWLWADRISIGGGIVQILLDIFSKTGSNSSNVYFAVANEVPMQWGEAWGYCNRYPNSKLVWQNNLKTCLKR
jgi:hypothetical protein